MCIVAFHGAYSLVLRIVSWLVLLLYFEGISRKAVRGRLPTHHIKSHCCFQIFYGASGFEKLKHDDYNHRKLMTQVFP